MATARLWRFVFGREQQSLEIATTRCLISQHVDFQSNLAKLTPRELDVCELVKEGRSTKEIAEEMHLSPERELA